jgi:hypothetical protein
MSNLLRSFRFSVLKLVFNRKNDMLIKLGTVLAIIGGLSGERYGLFEKTGECVP